MSHNIMPSSPADRQKMKSSFDRITDSQTRIQGEVDFINAEKKSIKENFSLDNALITKIIKSRKARNADELRSHDEDFDLFHEALWETVTFEEAADAG